MAIYFVFYYLFVLFLSVTFVNYGYLSVVDRSRGLPDIFYTVFGIGIGVLIAFSIIHFFIVDWWVALILIISTVFLVPIIAFLCRPLFLIRIIAPILTVVFLLSFLGYAIYLLGQ